MTDLKAGDQQSDGTSTARNQPKAGDRVRVTYEAEYKETSPDGWHSVGRDRYRPLVPPDATIEVIKPVGPAEPQAFGSLVEVDGEKWVRADEDGYPWRGDAGDWEDWDSLQRKGDITVLFDPDKAQDLAVTQAKPESPVYDSEDDAWYWHDHGPRGAGYYLVESMYDEYETSYYYPDRYSLAEKWGPLSPF